MNGPSEHLSWQELACKDGSHYPDTYITDGRVARLATLFENVRAIYDKPIEVLSAYRTISHNKKIGGARNSQHLYGRALDLKPPKGVKVDKFYNDIKNCVDLFGIKGLGKYKTFVHVDIRPTSKTVYWFGSGAKDS